VNATEKKKRDAKAALRKRILLSVVVLFTAFVVFGAGAVVKVFAQEAQPQAAAAEMSAERARVAQFGLVAAAIAFGFGAIGAGIAIGNVGAAAMGAIGEKPEIASQALIFVALAEGLVVFGFITALMILGRI
jgi:V/A-type H+-transporting ATPase subunit K